MYRIDQLVKILYWRLKNKIDRLYWRERKVKYGSAYGDKVFFVLRRKTPYNGIGSHVIVFLGLLKHMENKYPQAIPIIDFKNYKQAIAEEDGTNVWECFFEQPNSDGFSLNDLNEAKNVVLSADYGYIDGCELPNAFSFEELKEQGWSDLFRKYIRINKKVLEEFDAEWHRIADSGSGRIIGVKARGTDYNTLKPKGHSIQPTYTMIADKVDCYLRGGYSRVYLATEDNEIRTMFLNSFKDKVIVPQENSIFDYKGGIITYNDSNLVPKKTASLEYLKEMYFLSKCEGFVSGRNSGVIMVLLLNGGDFQDTYVFDLGCY